MADFVLESIQERGDLGAPSTPSQGREFGPTDAIPGSREKLEILVRRSRLGLPLWHPEDRHAEGVMIVR